MTSKEATVFVVDLGQSMSEKRHGRDQSDLDWTLEYVWDKITTNVATGRKSALLSVIGCHTNETDLAGVMQEVEGYENLTVFSELKRYTLDDILKLQVHLKPSRTDQGDLISALAIAVQMIDTTTRGSKGNPLKYDRRVIIVTNGRGHIDTQDLRQIATKVKDVTAPIELVLLGVDFDDPENGYKEENKDPEKEATEVILKSFVAECEGCFGTLAVAIEQLHIPRLREVRPMPNYKGQLILGDVEKYEATLSIDVERYPCIMLAKPPTASSFVVRTDSGSVSCSNAQSYANTSNAIHSKTHLSLVRNQRYYQVDDLPGTGTKRNVEKGDLERGYEYGRTAVHVSESDMNVFTLETRPSLQIVGFIKAEEFERQLPLSRSHFIISQRLNQPAQLGLSSFIHALYEAGCYAVARMVTKELKPPLLLLLVPRIELEWEALVDVELPFEEDMRYHKFPPLDRKYAVSGKVITEHKDLPSQQLLGAMSDYVEAMDLSTLNRDENGNEEEYARPHDTFSPLLHRLDQSVRWRVTHLDSISEIPDAPEISKKYMRPPADLLARAKEKIDVLSRAADVKRVPVKVKGRGKRQRGDRDRPLSDLDVEELLGGSERVKLESANLIPSFKQALDATDDLATIRDAADAIAKEIRKLIGKSIGNEGYEQALEAIGVMRKEMIDIEEPELYNTFIRELQRELLDGQLNGNRREMWWKIKEGRQGLINQKESLASNVTEAEVRDFYEHQL